MKDALIDTNIYSYAMKGDPEIIYILRQLRLIGITSVSIGELLSGFKGGIKEQDIATAIYVQLDRVVRISNHINVERSRSEELVRDGYITSTSQIYGE